MQFDWQTIAVTLIIAAALFYVARRATARLRSFGANKGGSCSTGCGTCGDVDAPVRQSNVLVHIGKPKGEGHARR